MFKNKVERELSSFPSKTYKKIVCPKTIFIGDINIHLENVNDDDVNMIRIKTCLLCEIKCHLIP